MIVPKDIDTSRHPFDAFGHIETEISALWVVRLLKNKNLHAWVPFSLEELEEFYGGRFYFNGLMDRPIANTYVSGPPDRMVVSDEFVRRYASSAGIVAR